MDIVYAELLCFQGPSGWLVRIHSQLYTDQHMQQHEHTSLEKSNVMFTTAYAKPNYFTGGQMVAKMYMTPADTAFFGVLVNVGCTIACVLLNYDVAH